jgi:hypothetical protein
MSRILAIDPGSTQSAWLLANRDGTVVDFGLEANASVLNRLRLRQDPGAWMGQRLAGGLARIDVVVIEKIESYGMAVGAEVFATVWWSGRFAEAAEQSGLAYAEMPRRRVKLELCGSSQAKDANIRQALIDRFGGATAIGKKAEQGPLYGVSKDVWSALAIAVTYASAA